jgi:hypothetical protein
MREFVKTVEFVEIVEVVNNKRQTISYLTI